MRVTVRSPRDGPAGSAPTPTRPVGPIAVRAVVRVVTRAVARAVARALVRGRTGPRAATALGACALLAGGCASYPETYSTVEPTSVAVVGVGRLEGVAEELNGSVAARDLVARLGERRRVLAPRAVRAALGTESWTALMERDAAGGSLGARDVRLLAGAGLGTRFALIVRVERDAERSFGPDTISVVDERGRVLRDRVRERYATRRETVVSAELVDLGVPGSLWRREFGADPTTTTESVRYRGSSFSGSVAARLANTVVNGPGGAGPPPAASLRRTLESLFDEIDLAIPAGRSRR